MNSIDRIILEKCNDRPMWAKSLKAVNPRVTALVNAGYLERIVPPGSTQRGRNMLTLTASGRQILEREWKRLA